MQWVAATSGGKNQLVNQVNCDERKKVKLLITAKDWNGHEYFIPSKKWSCRHGPGRTRPVYGVDPYINGPSVGPGVGVHAPRVRIYVVE